MDILAFSHTVWHLPDNPDTITPRQARAVVGNGGFAMENLAMDSCFMGGRKRCFLEREGDNLRTKRLRLPNPLKCLVLSASL